LRDDYFLYVKDILKIFTPSDAKFYKLSNDIRISVKKKKQISRVHQSDDF